MSQRAPQIAGLTFVRNLGAGGYADVYLYEEAMPRRQVAVKVLRTAGISASLLPRFRQEANAMAQLSHPNIVPVYYVATTASGQPYIVMKYYPRDSLAERSKKERLPVAEILQLGIKLASAAETAHQAGLLHRDIKPANVLTDEYGEPGLGDFGIAADIATGDDTDLGVSVPWSPPELLYASAPPSVRSDVYSLAATLWHLLVGRSPFEAPRGDNSQFAMMKRIRDTPPPSTGRPDVPMSLDRLLRTSMSKDPAVRPATALNFARALQIIEQELRLPRTRLVIAADDASSAKNRSALLEDLTRVQAKRVEAQLPAAHSDQGKSRHEVGRSRATSAESTQSSLHQGSSVRSEQSGTVLPASQGSVPEDDLNATERPNWLLWVLVGLLIASMIVLGWILTKTPILGQAPEPTTSLSLPPPDPYEPPPGPLKFTGTRDGKTLTITWTYTHAKPDDTFFWRNDPSREWQLLPEAKLVMENAPEGEVCIWVRVRRNSGNFGTREGTKGCV